MRTPKELSDSIKADFKALVDAGADTSVLMYALTTMHWTDLARTLPTDEAAQRLSDGRLLVGSGAGVDEVARTLGLSADDLRPFARTPQQAHDARVECPCDICSPDAPA